jgi:hypothetical protein
MRICSFLNNEGFQNYQNACLLALCIRLVATTWDGHKKVIPRIKCIEKNEAWHINI